MLSLTGIDRKSYAEWFEGFPTDLLCPCCDHSHLAPHGSYLRYVDDHRMRIRRGRCPWCEVTHAILPEDVCAYRDLTLEDLASVLSARGPTEAAHQLGDASEAGVRRARRLRQAALAERARQAERVLPAAPDPAPWWQRALEAYGSLLSWRRWLWRQTGYFVTGLLGLFRQGRAPWLAAEVST